MFLFNKILNDLKSPFFLHLKFNTQMHTIASSGMYFAQMSRNLTTKYYFFIENTSYKNTFFYEIKLFLAQNSQSMASQALTEM